MKDQFKKFFTMVGGCPQLVDAPVKWRTLIMSKSRWGQFIGFWRTFSVECNYHFQIVDCTVAFNDKYSTRSSSCFVIWPFLKQTPYNGSLCCRLKTAPWFKRAARAASLASYSVCLSKYIQNSKVRIPCSFVRYQFISQHINSICRLTRSGLSGCLPSRCSEV